MQHCKLTWVQPAVMVTAVTEDTMQLVVQNMVQYWVVGQKVVVMLLQVLKAILQTLPEN